MHNSYQYCNPAVKCATPGLSNVYGRSVTFGTTVLCRLVIVSKHRDFTQVNNMIAGQVYDQIWKLKGIRLGIQSKLFIDIEVTRVTFCYQQIDMIIYYLISDKSYKIRIRNFIIRNI